jgi:hypothetical protein
MINNPNPNSILKVLGLRIPGLLARNGTPVGNAAVNGTGTLGLAMPTGQTPTAALAAGIPSIAALGGAVGAGAPGTAAPGAASPVPGAIPMNGAVGAGAPAMPVPQVPIMPGPSSTAMPQAGATGAAQPNNSAALMAILQHFFPQGGAPSA